MRNIYVFLILIVPTLGQSCGNIANCVECVVLENCTFVKVDGKGICLRKTEISNVNIQVQFKNGRRCVYYKPGMEIFYFYCI
jgi:hypothetical protein